MADSGRGQQITNLPEEEPVKEGQEGEKHLAQTPSSSKIATNQEQEMKQIQQQIDSMTLHEDSSSPVKSEEEPTSKDPKNSKSAQIANEPVEMKETRFLIETSRTNVIFGKNVLFPGSIEEFDIALELKDEAVEDGNTYTLRVIAKCCNQEFNDLDQYVFSVRSNERFEYFEEVRFKIRKKERAQVKVAVKVPSVKEGYSIEGVLQIQIENLLPLCLPISAKCQVPQIICIKDLFKADEGATIIKVPAKKNQPRMPPIPFKNLSALNLTLEVEAISNEIFTNRPYDIITQNFVNAPANNQFFVNIQLRENINYKGPIPSRDTIRKILILKIKNSSVLYNFPLEVTVFEGNSAAGNIS